MSKLRQIIFKAACFYTVSSLIYVLLVALMVKGSATVSNAYLRVFGNLAVLFGFSCVFGASFLVFDLTKIPVSARRLLHVAVLYAAMLVACFLMANVTDDLRSKVLFVFMATFLFIVAYCVGMLISHIAKKKQ